MFDPLVACGSEAGGEESRELTRVQGSLRQNESAVRTGRISFRETERTEGRRAGRGATV